MRLRKIRLDPQCLATARNCLVQAAQFQLHVAQIVVRLGEFRLQSQRAAVTLPRFLEPAGTSQRVAQIQVRDGILGHAVDCACQRGQCIAALLRNSNAEQLPEHPGLRATLEQLACRDFQFPVAPGIEQRTELRPVAVDAMIDRSRFGCRRLMRQGAEAPAATLEFSAATAAAWIVSSGTHHEPPCRRPDAANPPARRPATP